jgi:broad specificity phosphatase PhoE
MATFILMRHGDCDIESARRGRKLIGGCADWVPLSVLGISQVEAKLADIAGLGINRILSSPMTRALHSAAIINAKLAVPLHVEFDLHEWMPDMTFRFESFEEVRQAISARKANANEWPHGQPQRWESFSQVRARVRRVLRRFDTEDRILVVCHHAVIEALTGESLGCAMLVRYELPA